MLLKVKVRKYFLWKIEDTTISWPLFSLINDSFFLKELVISKNSCRFAQLKCSYRTGCGSTLQSFIIECDGLIHNKTNVCSETCKNTLVGLTSTLEGQKLMTVSYIS